MHWRVADALCRAADKNVGKDVFHPVLDVDQQGRPGDALYDQFVQPKDFEEGVSVERAFPMPLKPAKAFFLYPFPLANSYVDKTTCSGCTVATALLRTPDLAP
ncbi:carbon starvation induced protein CsiD [Escherichia coli]